MKLALGPVQYYWPKDKIFAFYQEAAALPLDIIYLGETVCARRHELREDDWLALAAMLSGAGKEVILSTQVLLESGAHLQAMHRIVENGHYMVEANDMGAVGCMSGGKPFVAGMHLNLYNPAAVRFMADLGARRWVVPMEMGRENVKKMLAELPGAIQTEVVAYGRLPLAFSARCFTARYHNLQKDACGFRCLHYPDGLQVKTCEDRDFLVFNGVQVQSAHVYNLILEVPDLRTYPVDVLRLLPQSEHMPEIISLFRDVMENRVPAEKAFLEMAPLMPGKPANGYWHNGPGMTWYGNDGIGKENK